MNRRRYLSVVGAAVGTAVAGCLGSSPESSSGGTAPDESPTPTESPAGPGTTHTSTVPPVGIETPAPGECSAPDPPDPSTGEGLPDPREYPDSPERFDPERVRPFVEAYEGAYRYNERLADLAGEGACVEDFETEVTGSTLRETDDGVVAEVVTTGSFTGETCPDATGTDTATPLPHADFFTQAAVFLVTDRFLVREDRVVECWE